MSSEISKSRSQNNWPGGGGGLIFVKLRNEEVECNVGMWCRVLSDTDVLRLPDKKTV